MEIRLEKVSFKYNENTAMEVAALDNINLKISEGEFIGLIGHTGSGKSTLMQHLNGIIKPTSGNVYFNGEDINAKKYKKSKVRSNVGLVFQYPEYQLFEETVFKDVAFGPTNLKLSDEEIRNRVINALNLVNLGEEYYDKSPFSLSGGEKRRVAIAGVLAIEPKFLILDEPAAGLDPRGRDNILSGIAKLNKKLGITIIMVSHSMEDIANYTDRIIVMNKGKIEFDDTPKEVFKNIDELNKIGLSIPTTSQLLLQLKKLGWNVDNSIFDIKEVEMEILRELKDD